MIAHEASHRLGWGAVLLWTVSLLSALYTLMALIPVFRRMAGSCPILELGKEALILPYGFLHKKTKKIGYADIRAVHEEKAHGQRVLVLHASRDYGRITASLLPDEDAYASVKRFLSGKANLEDK
jgi:hypothetical protein